MNNNQDKKPRKSSTTEGKCSTRRSIILPLVNFLATKKKFNLLEDIAGSIDENLKKEKDQAKRTKAFLTMVYIQHLRLIEPEEVRNRLISQLNVKKLNKFDGRVFLRLLGEEPSESSESEESEDSEESSDSLDLESSSDGEQEAGKN